MTTSRYPVHIAVTQMSSSKRSAVRKSFLTPKLTAQKYEVRIRRTEAEDKADNVLDTIFLSDINEIILETLTYPNTALVALKVRLTDQLSGLPKVTYINGGRLIKVFGRATESATTDTWYDSPSSNPAWVIWDMLTNVRFGGSMPSSRLDFVAFKNWADHCDAKALTWNGVIDSQLNVWDATQLVLRAGHAQLVNIGTRYSVVVEKVDDPVMMFSVANMVEGSYKETWLPTADRANEIDITFFDQTDDYRSRTIKVYDPSALTNGRKQRSSAITLYGVVDYERAYKEAQFQLNLNHYVLKTVQFTAPLESVACSVGDLIYVQHDMTEWAVAGRFEAGSTTSLVNLDRSVRMETGKSYKLLLTHDAVQRYAGTVQTVVGNSVLLNGLGPTFRVKRLQINGQDIPIGGTFTQGASHGVYLNDVAGIAPGQAYTAWDTDVIEEYSVITLPGGSPLLRMQTPIGFVPQQYGNWMFGETAKVKNIFRIKSITGSQDDTREIVALQYSSEIYENTRFGSNTPTAPTQTAVIGAAQNLQLYEETYIEGAVVTTKLVASWNTPVLGLYAGADLYVKVDDGEIIKTQEVKNRTSATIAAAPKSVVTVKVVAFDIFGKRAPYETAPELTYTVIGEVPAIDVGSVTGADFIWSGKDCKISWRYNSTTHSFEFGSEPTGADAGSLDTHFKDYEIRVYNEDGKTLRRTEYTTDNSWVYIYDKNFADGLARHLVFEVRMRDAYNNLGKPAILEAYNPPPTILSTTPIFNYNSATISYTRSNDPDFAGAEIWLSPFSAHIATVEPSDANSVYVGPDSSIMVPELQYNTVYYYRIAAFDAFGRLGSVPSAVQSFQTPFFDVEAIADGVLGDSLLAEELRARIDLIDGPAGLAGSVTARLLEQTGATNLRLNEAVSALTVRANGIETYANTIASDLVAEALARGTAITNEHTLWTNVTGAQAGQITTLTAVTNANVAAISSEQTARTNADSALSTRVDSTVAATNANAAAIITEQTARTNADSAMATNISAVTATANAAAAAVIVEQTARASADSAISSNLTAVTATANGAAAAVVTEQNARVSQGNTFASQISAVTATANGAAAGVVTEQSARIAADGVLATNISAVTVTANNAAAGVTTETNARISADSALATQISTVSATAANAAAAVVTETNARVAQDSVIAGQITAITATANGAAASVVTETNTRISQDLIIADYVVGLNTTVNGHTTSIATNASTTNGLSAQYTVKIDNNGYVSGFGLASSPVNGVPTSEFIVLADKFAVITPGSPTSRPFTIGQVNGVTKTMISGALIGDATIGTLSVGANQITVPSGAHGFGSVPTVYVTLSQPGQIFVTVTAAANASDGSTSSLYLNTYCGGQNGPAVGVSLAGGYSGFATAAATFSMGAGTHAITGGFVAPNRTVGATSVMAIGVMR